MKGGYLTKLVNDTGAYMPFDSDRYTFISEEKACTYTPYGNDLVDHFFNHLVPRNSQYSSKGSIEDIFEDRITLIRSKIELLLVQLSERKKIHEDVIYQIDTDSCTAQNLILYKASVEQYYGIYRERINIERIKFDLEDQKRRENTNYFRDTALLNRELREALIEYQEEVQKNSLISEKEANP